MEEYNKYSDFDLLPPLKRFSLLHKQKHQSTAVPTTLEDDLFLFTLPAKKRKESRVIHSTAVAAAAFGAEMVTMFSLPTKKRVRSFRPGFVKNYVEKTNGSVKTTIEEGCGENIDELSLPEKKRNRSRNALSRSGSGEFGCVAGAGYEGNAEKMTTAFLLPNKKRVMALQPDFVSFGGLDLNVEYKPELVDEPRVLRIDMENLGTNEGQKLDISVENVEIGDARLETGMDTVEIDEAKQLEICMVTAEIGEAKQLDIGVENVENSEAKQLETGMETVEIGVRKQLELDTECVEIKQSDIDVDNMENGEAEQSEFGMKTVDVDVSKHLELDTGNVGIGEVMQIVIGIEKRENTDGNIISHVIQELGLGDESDEEEEAVEISEINSVGDVENVGSFDGGAETNVKCQATDNPAKVSETDLVDCRYLQEINIIGNYGCDDVGEVTNFGAGEGEARLLDSAIEPEQIDEAKKLDSSNENVENTESKIIQVFEELGLHHRFDEEETPDEITEKEFVGCGDLEDLDKITNFSGAVGEGAILENVTSFEDVVIFDGKCEGAVLENVINMKIDDELEDLQNVTNSDGAVVGGCKFEGLEIPAEVTEKETAECLNPPNVSNMKGEDRFEGLQKAANLDAVVDADDGECEDQKDVSDLDTGVDDDDEESEDGIVCGICQSTDADPSDPIVLCDGCDLMVHATCYGNPLIQGIPEGDWFCHKCASEAIKPLSCCLCPSSEGALKHTTDGRWAHLVCAVYVPEVFFVDPEGREGIDVSKILPKRWKRQCYVCQSRKGCVVHCSESKCCLSFHVTCGLKEDLCIEYKEGKTKKGGIVAGFCKDHTKLWKKQQQTGKFKIVAREE